MRIPGSIGGCCGRNGASRLANDGTGNEKGRKDILPARAADSLIGSVRSEVDPGTEGDLGTVLGEIGCQLEGEAVVQVIEQTRIEDPALVIETQLRRHTAPIDVEDFRETLEAAGAGAKAGAHIVPPGVIAEIRIVPVSIV